MISKSTVLSFLIIFVLVTGAVSPAFAVHEHDATSITDNLIVNADINSAAAIAASKLVGTDITTVGTITTGTWQGTTIAVDQGGTGATTLTDGGILLGSGTGAVTPTAVLGDGEILIGDGTTDPVALDVGSSTAITVLGTITTGTWQGTTIAVDQGGTGVTTSTGSGSVVLGTNPVLTAATLAGDIDADGFDIDDGGVIFLREQAEADADVAGQGQIWVDTQTPNKLFFTDDAGTDFQIGGAGGALNNVVEDTTPQLGGSLDAQDNQILNIGNAGTDFGSDGSLTTAAGITATTGGLTATAGSLTISDSDGTNSITSDDATAAVTDVLTLAHSIAAGAGTSGIGTGISFNVEDGDDVEEQGSLDVTVSTVTGDGEDAEFRWSLNSAGTITERMVLDDTGALTTDAGITATTGGVTATAGGLTATAGGVTITAGELNLGSPATRTVASNTFAISSSYQLADTSAGVQTLNTITGAAAGDILILGASSASNALTITDANIGGASDTFALVGDSTAFVTDSLGDSMMFIFNGNQWVEISRTNVG